MFPHIWDISYIGLISSVDSFSVSCNFIIFYSQTRKRHFIILWRYEFVSRYMAWSILSVPMLLQGNLWGISSSSKFHSTMKHFVVEGLPGVGAFAVLHVPVEFSFLFYFYSIHFYSFLSMWFKVKKLSLNLKQTKFMVFKPRQKRSICNIQISIDNQNIVKVKETNFLGVILDKT